MVVMLYVRFPLWLRNVEDLLYERGIDLCHGTVRLWWNRFGPMFAADFRRQRDGGMRAFRHWRWHLDGIYAKVGGEMRYLRRVVDHQGEILESYVARCRDRTVTLAFPKMTQRPHCPAVTIVTDGLRSFPAAMRELGNEQCREKMNRHANNRAENSRLPFCRRERAMQRFRHMKSLQKFASAHSSIHRRPLVGCLAAISS